MQRASRLNCLKNRARRWQHGLCRMAGVLHRQQAVGCWVHPENVCMQTRRMTERSNQGREVLGPLPRIIATMGQPITGGSYAWNRKREGISYYNNVCCLPLSLGYSDEKLFIIPAPVWVPEISSTIPIQPQFIYDWVHCQWSVPPITSSQHRSSFIGSVFPFKHLPDSIHFSLIPLGLCLPLRWMLQRTKATR